MPAKWTPRKTARKQLREKPHVKLVPEKIAELVLIIRGEKVLLDTDLADMYSIETGALNRAVKRNIKRFPKDFMFQLSPKEWEDLKCQIGISGSKHGGRRTLPYAFTEQGVAMLSSVLNAPLAIEVNIAIMRTFVQLRQLMDSNRLLADKIESLEAKYREHEGNFQTVFNVIKQLISEQDKPGFPKRRAGFHPD